MKCENNEVNVFLKDTKLLSALPVSKSILKQILPDYPFDGELLTLSKVYRQSRELYLNMDGKFCPRLSSLVRSLSAQDLFKSEIDYTPADSEIRWFRDNHHEVYEPDMQVKSLFWFNTISVFHEQNHRIIWPLLPPPAAGDRNLCRYLNFSESLVVMLDLALADEVTPKFSNAFERMKVIYRAGHSTWKNKSKAEYRNYLLATMVATYMILEWVHSDDVLAALDYVLPGQKKMNRDAVDRAFDINELFTKYTNPEWQKRNAKEAGRKLKKIHAKSRGPSLALPESVLDLDAELVIARQVLRHFKI